MAASTINLPALISAQAQAVGVPPAIALAVAQKESSVSQWTRSGGLVTGSSGEIGVFQLMPATAAALGVDPTDVNQNIQGGIAYLAQLFQKYGSWTSALSAYNSGSPTGSPSYASSVLGLANSLAPSLPAVASDASASDDGTTADFSAVSAPSPVSGALIVGGILGGIALVWWALT